MSTISEGKTSQSELAKRGVLAHVEHIRSVGEALTKAVDTFMIKQKASESMTDWRDDFADNVSESSKEFHRTLANSVSKVADIYFGEDENLEDIRPRTTKKGGSATTADS